MIGKAKRAMIENGNEMIHFEEYDDKIDITSVVIPINKKYEKYKNLDIEDIEIKINKVDSIGVINKSDYYNCKEKDIKQDFSPCFLFCIKWLCC